MYEKMQEFALTEITPLPCTSAVWGQRPVLFHPESPQGVWSGWLQRLTATRQASCLNLEFPRGSPSGWLSWDDLTTAISCLLIRQKAFFFHWCVLSQECWSGLLCPTPGDLPTPGIEPTSLLSPALAGRLFTTILRKNLFCSHSICLRKEEL